VSRSAAPALFELSGIRPDATAVEDGRRRVSWFELDARSTMVGHGVEALGAAPGSHVAICVSNRAEFVEAVLGAWRAGCAYTPLKTGWTADEVGAVLDDARTRVVITDRPGARAAAEARGIVVVTSIPATRTGWARSPTYRCPAAGTATSSPTHPEPPAGPKAS
jgi:acyl-CoA synthetase (AMP-forming)/AMP-acid ligase II